MTDQDVSVRGLAVQDTQAVQVTQAGPINQVVPVAVDNHDPHREGPRPIGTLMVVAILLLVTIAFWMLVLGIQQARA